MTFLRNNKAIIMLLVVTTIWYINNGSFTIKKSRYIQDLKCKSEKNLCRKTAAFLEGDDL